MDKSLETTQKKNNEEKSLTLAELMYLLYFTVMLVAKGFGLYSGQKLYALALGIGAVLFAAKLILSEYSAAEYIIIIALFLLCVAIYIHSDEIGEFIILATVTGMKNVSVKRVMKLGCVIWAITYMASMLMALLGLRSDIFRAQDKFGLGYIVRWSLGQPHPNVLQISCIVLCAFILYVGQFRGKKLYIATLLMLCANIYIFIYSISYTGFALAIMYLVLNMYLTEWRCRGDNSDGTFSIIEKMIAVLVIPLCLSFSVFGPVYFKGRLWDICNKALNTRFNIAKNYMGLNPVSLFGSGYCNELPSDLNNLDCSYVFSLMHYGIIFFILFWGAYIGLIVYCVLENKRKELAIIIAMVVAAISEPFFVNPSFKNITLIFLGEFLFVFLDKVFPKSFAFFRKPILSLNGIGQKEVKLTVVDSLICFADKFVSALKRRAKLIVITGLIVGMAAASIYALTVKMPGAYYMNRDTVQVNGEHGFTIDINDLPDDFDGVFLEYTSPERLMMRLDGNAVKVEYYRSIISILLWGSLCSMGALNICLMMASKCSSGKEQVK